MNKTKYLFNRITILGLLVLLISSFFYFSVTADGATRGTAETNRCDTAIYSISGQTGDPWVYGCVDTAHGKACKKSTGEINPTFVIPNPTTDTTYQRLLQTCGSKIISTADSSNKCDTAQFHINDIAGDPYAYGCVDATHAKSCKKSEGGIFRASFEIPASGSDQAYQRLRQQCGSTPVSSSGSTVAAIGVVSCANPQQCREIDEVWQMIGSLVRGSSEVWDMRSAPFDWRSFTLLYPITSITGASPTITPGPNAYDAIIQEATAPGTGVEFALVKAIMVAESNFKPNDISTTGCSGLLQICASSAKDEIQVQCPQVRSLGPRKCDAGSCAAGRLSRAPNVPWCNVCVTGNNCVDDDRFDPRKNIFSATKTIKRKMDAIPVDLCGVECQVAAYNIGESVIKAAARASGTYNPNDQSQSWDEVYSSITIDLMKQNGYDDTSQWTDTDLEQKRVHLKGYVAKVMSNYQSYKAGTS